MILGRAGINKLISKAQDALALALVMHSSRCAIEIVILSDKLKLPSLPPLQIALALSLAIAINFNYKNIVNCWVKEGVIYKCFMYARNITISQSSFNGLYKYFF